MREIFEKLPVGGFILSDDWTVLDVNLAAERLLRFDTNVLLGQNFSTCLTPYYQEMFRSALSLLKDHHPEVLDFELLGVQGTRLPVELRIARLKNPLRYLLTTTCLEAESAEAKKADFSGAYRFLVFGEMARGLAHEINQPLAAILNYSSSGTRRLKGNGLTPEVAENLCAQIGIQAQRAADVIRRMRALLRREPAGREQSSLNALVLDAIKQTKSDILRVQGVHLRVVLGKDLPTVQVDPLQITQALMNLISSALESMGPEPMLSPRLIVCTSAKVQDQVEVCIRDNGLWTGKEISELIHSPLFSTEHSSIRLRLAVSRAIIEGHGGRLWATQNHQRGITVHAAFSTIPIKHCRGQLQ
ncbi:hypothetical protein CCP3SC1AL1_2000005 [Gammaproteobacteria bacterium]